MLNFNPLYCLVFAFLLCFGAQSRAQSFHFNDTSTTLIKTTDNSPAHWYLEIFNDVGVDTTLRWKASFENIETNWVISFDDQDNYYANVQDGDSADFMLWSGLSFPQKLIIGNTLNNTTGTGSVFFDIYDPNDLASTVTIEFKFIISAGANSVDEYSPLDHLNFTNKSILVDGPIPNNQYQIYSISGSLISQGEIGSNGIDLSYLEQGIYTFQFLVDGTFYSEKFSIR